MAHDLRRRESREQTVREAEDDYATYEDFAEFDMLSTKNLPAREGFTQRWVRTKIKGVDDYTNVQRKMAKGWKPRLLSSAPKGQFISHIQFMGQDVIGNPMGMLLMERPEEMHARERIHVKRMVNNQLIAVEQSIFNLRGGGDRYVNDPTMSVRQTHSQGGGREAAVDD